MLNEVKNKFTFASSLVTAMGCLLLFLARTFNSNVYYLNNVHLLVICFILLYTSYRVKKYESRKLFNIFFFTYIHTVYIYTCLQTGGFSSSQVQWYYVFSFAITVLFSIKTVGFYYLYHTFVLCGLSYFVKGDNVLGRPDFTQYFVVSTVLLGCVIYFNHIYQSYILKDAQLQKADALSSFRRKLLHEVNNPLTVIRVIADRYVKTDPTDLNEKLYRNSLRIEEVMSRIHNTDNETLIGNSVTQKKVENHSNV